MPMPGRRPLALFASAPGPFAFSRQLSRSFAVSTPAFGPRFHSTFSASRPIVS